VVYATASLALESTYFWYSFERNYGWGGGGGHHLVEPLSLFGAAAFQKSWLTGANIDAASCLIGMTDKLWLGGGGPVGWKLLGATCALYGGGGSLLYAMS
jgi:hypothetical protein